MAVLDRIPVGQIGDEAREVQFSRVLVAVITGVLFGLGWVVAKVVGAVWFALVWSAVAVKVGYQAGREPRERRHR